MSNYFVQELVLYRHFMLIDSPIPFELIANPTNFRKDEHGNILNQDLSQITGRDICSRPAGAWRVDCWTLLPEKYHKQNPVFTMLIKYDKDLLEEGEIVDIRYSDIDIGEGVAGVNGQLVSIAPEDFRPIVLAIEDVSSKIGSTSDSGTVLNELEQIRTILKSPSSAGASTPWGSILSTLSKILPHSFIRTINEFRDFAFSLTPDSGFLVSGLFVIQNASYFIAISGLFHLSTFSLTAENVGFYLRSVFIEGVYAPSIADAGVSVKSCNLNIIVNSSSVFSTGSIFTSGGSRSVITLNAVPISTIDFGFVG